MIWIKKLYIWIHLSGLSPDCQGARGLVLLPTSLLPTEILPSMWSV